MHIKKVTFYLLLLFFYNAAFSQLQNEDSITIPKYGYHNELTVGKGLSYFIDPGRSIDFPEIQSKRFTVPPAVFFKKFNTHPQENYYWARFSIKNNTDSVLQPLIYYNAVNYVNLYLVSPNQPVQKIVGGSLRDRNETVPKEEKNSVLLVTLAPQQAGVVYIRMVQKTQEFFFTGIQIYKRNAFYNTVENYYYQNRHGIVWGLLFQGFVLCQILYILFQWVIIKRKEYLYYFFYLVTILLFFLSKQEAYSGESFLFANHPIWCVYLDNTLQIAPYFLYYRFIRFFLEIGQNHPTLNKWMIRTEYFLLAYLVFDFVLVTTTFNIQLQTKIFAYIISMVFIVTSVFIFYLLKKKQTFIYFVLLGSLAVGLGNILGVVFTFLIFNEHIQIHINDTLIFSEIGIVIEILCFTVGLSYKNKLIEKEKSVSQEKLINQLKENQLLNSKMLNIRNKISLDLHDEIGSTLSSISILSEMAINEKKENETAAMLEEIKQNSVSVMERMDDIVWNINPNNDSMEQLFLRIKVFAAKLFEAKGINYKIDIDENVKHINVLMEYRQHIYLIMKEAINNLVKYSDCTEAEVIAFYDSSLLNLLIKDNGKGYDVNQITYGNGLNSMSNRAEEMDAELNMISKMNEGTTIQLFVKI
ncbi:MAG TPA: 7TM diverse intracellular signaling domain-containing protein [Hanamia sp.]|nr:7TM diverse intracellular signaling domain-containing protein [Hanamia sp.]